MPQLICSNIFYNKYISLFYFRALFGMLCLRWGGSRAMQRVLLMVLIRFFALFIVSIFYDVVYFAYASFAFHVTLFTFSLP